MWGYDNGVSSSSELGCMGRGEVAQWEDGWGVGDEGSSLGEHGGMARGEAARREDG